MNPAQDIRPDRRMDRAMPLDPAHRPQLGRAQPQPEMRLPALAISGMAPVAFAFVNDFNFLHVKGTL